MFTSLRANKPLVRRQFMAEYDPATTSNTDSSNLPPRKRGFSLSKQHAIAFDRIYTPKDLKAQEEEPNTNANSMAIS